MKKYLLLFGALALTAGIASADSSSWNKRNLAGKAAAVAPLSDECEYAVFGYCVGYTDAVGQYGNLQAAIEIPAATAQQLAGAKLTGVRLGIGEANRNEVTVFLTENLKGKAFYEQAATITTKNGWNEITLDTPYEITGKKFYIGYKYDKCQQNEFPIGIDGVPTNNTLGGHIAVGNQWDNVSTMFGSMAIRAILEGDNLPKNDVAVTEIAVPGFQKANQEFVTQVRVVNQGTRIVEQLALECSIGSEKIENPVFTMSSPKIMQGENAVLDITLKTSQEGANLPVSVTVTQVNNSADENPENNVATGYGAFFENGFPKKMVVEEWTGTWCGWCVRGIVGMEYMEDTYGNDGFIGIAVHSGDEMEISSYAPFLNTWALVGYPGAAVNRKYQFDPSKELLLDYYSILSKEESYTQVKSIQATLSEDGTSLDAEATVNFSVPVETGAYRLAFVITENGVGPYTQVNYYSGGGYGPMDGWEQKPARAPYKFNEVARNIVDCNGIPGSLPTSIEANTDYSYTANVSLAQVSKLNHCKLIVLIINNETGEIVNAEKMSLYEAGVEGVATDSVKVGISQGEILIEGNYSSARIYRMDGVEIAAEGNRISNLAPGVYVVSITDEAGNIHTSKVAVR